MRDAFWCFGVSLEPSAKLELVPVFLCLQLNSFILIPLILNPFIFREVYKFDAEYDPDRV